MRIISKFGLRNLLFEGISILLALIYVYIVFFYYKKSNRKIIKLKILTKPFKSSNIICAII